MRRLLPLVPLLLFTMGIGPCDPQPLGSADGGGGPAADGGSPTADGGGPAADAGTPGTGGASSLDAGVIPPRDGGASDSRGGADASSPGAPDASFDAGRIPDAGTIPDAGGGVCVYGGVRYAAGASFPSLDGCNLCSCTSEGVACTLRACVPDAGQDVRGAACTPGQDQTCNDSPSVSALYGMCQADGTCLCRIGVLNPQTGRCGPGRDGGVAGCLYEGVVHPIGSSYPIDCNSCLCTVNGPACTEKACACSLDAVYQYGDIGGLVAYEDQVTLSPPSSYVHSRRSGLSGAVTSCASQLPPCRDPGIDPSDVMRDIQDQDVQAALARGKATLFGRDLRPVDGTVFQFRHGDGRSFLVGAPCAVNAGACVPTPAGVVRLVETLRALDRQQLAADPRCPGAVAP